MKKRWVIILTLIIIVCSDVFYSCGTIWGGSSYTSKFVVTDSDNVGIYYNGGYLGKDSAIIEIPRNKADRIDIALKKSGYEDYSYHFTKRITRVVPAVEAVLDALGVFNMLWSSGTRTTSTGGYYSTTKTVTIYIPIVSIINLSFGSYYKPNHHTNPNIHKINYDYFLYTLRYPYDSLYVDSIYNDVLAKSITYDSIWKIKNKELKIKDSLETTSNNIRKLILSDTLLIDEFYDNNSDEFHINQYVVEYPHAYYPNINFYLEILIPEMDEIFFNPMIDSSFQNYFERIYSYSNKNGYGPMNYLAYKYPNDIVEYKGIKMQKFKNGKIAGSVKIGTWIYYYESGTIKEIINYNLSGSKQGLYVVFNETGKIIEYKMYLNGVEKEI